MSLSPMTPEEEARGQVWARAEASKLYPELGGGHHVAASDIGLPSLTGNSRMADDLEGTGRVALVGGRYTFAVPPTPYVVVAELHARACVWHRARERARRALDERQVLEGEPNEEDVPLLVALADATAALLPVVRRILVPVGLATRYTWGRTPERIWDRLSDAEVATLLHFFQVCRTTSSVRLRPRMVRSSMRHGMRATG